MAFPRYLDQPQHEWPAFSEEFLRRFLGGSGHFPPGVPTRFFLGTGERAAQILRFANLLDSDLITLVWHGDCTSDPAKGLLQGLARNRASGTRTSKGRADGWRCRDHPPMGDGSANSRRRVVTPKLRVAGTRECLHIAPAHRARPLRQLGARDSLPEPQPASPRRDCARDRDPVARGASRRGRHPTRDSRGLRQQIRRAS